VLSQLPKSLFFREKLSTLAPYLPLPENWEDYYYSLTTKRRWLYRRKLRALQENGSVKYLRCDGRNLEYRLNKFFELHQTRWQSVGIRGMFSDPKVTQFYIDIASLFIKRGWLHFSYLAVDGEMVSGEYCFVYGNKLYISTAARDISYQKYSVGTLHFMYVVQDAIRAGLGELDLLKGDEHYKFHWTRLFRKYSQVVVIKKGRCPVLRIKWFIILYRIYELRQYGLREIYHLYLLRRRERAEKKRMGLNL
jgi:CelD/BcsL family acetyltransferase involved in cellulose biosynthesis